MSSPQLVAKKPVIADEIKGKPYEFMKQIGEQTLIDKHLITADEAKEPDFYAKNGKGYYYTMLIKDDATSGQYRCRSIMLECPTQELMEKCGGLGKYVETVLDRAKKLEHDTPKIQKVEVIYYMNMALGDFSFMIKDEKSFLETADSLMKILGMDLRLNIRAMAHNNEEVIKKYGFGPLIQLLEATGSDDIVKTNIGPSIEIYGIAKIIELAKYAKGGTASALTWIDDWHYKKKDNDEYHARNKITPVKEVDFNIDYAIKVAKYTGIETENALVQIKQLEESPSYARDMNIAKFDSMIDYTISKAGEYSGSVIYGLCSYHYLITPGKLSEEQLIDRLTEIAKQSGKNHKTVFYILDVLSTPFIYRLGAVKIRKDGLVSVAEVEETPEVKAALNKAKKNLEKRFTREQLQKLAGTEDEVSGTIQLITTVEQLKKFAEQANEIAVAGVKRFNNSEELRSLIKKYGFEPFVEIAKKSKGSFFPESYDVNLIRRYGTEQFVEFAGLYNDYVGEIIYNLRRNGYTELYNQMGVAPFIDIAKKNPKVEPYYISSIVNDAIRRLPGDRDIIKTEGDMQTLLDALISKNKKADGTVDVKNRNRTVDFLALFLAIHKDDSKPLDKLGEFVELLFRNSKQRTYFVDIPKLLGEFRNISFEKLTKRTDVYTEAYAIPRRGLYTNEDYLSKGLDVSQLVKETDSAERLATCLKLLANLSPSLAKKYASSVRVLEKWAIFNESEINSSNISKATNTSTIVTMYADLFPNEKKWKKYKKELTENLSKVKITDLKTVKTLQDLEESYKIADAFNGTAPQIAKTIRSRIIESIDFAELIRSVSKGKLDPKALEDARLKLNNINRVLGDEFILFVGLSMSKDKITKQNFTAKLDEIDTCCFSNPSSSYDVNRLYEMVGRFQANRLADFLVKNKEQFGEEEVNTAKEILENMGVSVEFEESTGSKAMRSLKQGQISYVVRKAWAKLSKGDALRQEMIDAKVTAIKPKKTELQNGFELKYYYGQKNEKIATVVIGDRTKGGGVDYKVNVGNGIDVPSLKQEYGKTLVALSVGAFTAGERKLADFAVINGNVVNYLVSRRDGLVIFYPDGTIDIKNIRTMKKSDIPTPGFYMKDEPLKFKEKVEDFNIIVKKFQKTKASAMQGQLLLYDGELTVGDKSSGVQDKRRCIATMEDGSFALIDFSQQITLLEAAVLAKKIGVKNLVNLDTGMYDYSQYIDRDGKVYVLGTMDSERPTNLIVLRRDASGAVPRKAE